MTRTAAIFCALALSSCAALISSLKAMAWPAGGAGAGAAAGMPFGPVGVVVGAAAGAVIGHAVDENAQLRSGELQGEGAGDKEIARWRGIAATKATAYDGLKLWATRAAFALGAWLAFKYLYPRSRAAKNFWGGILGVLKGEPGAVRKILSASGISHTP